MVAGDEVKYDAILFDFDGVLADSEPIHYATWMEALAPFGIHMSWETYQRESIGVSDRLMIEQLAASRTPPLAFDEVWAVYPAKRDALRIRLMTDPKVFLPETVELVKKLALEMPLAVVSSSGRNEVETPLVHAGIAGCFKTMVCGLEAGKLKPEPDPYLLAAQLLGVSRPLVVEDSAAGEASGKAAGFEVLRIGRPAELAVRVRARLG